MTQTSKSTSKDLEAFIREIPKTDLHLHLDGSLRPQTLIDIAKREKFKLPSYTVEGLNQTLFLDDYPDLEAYLSSFGFSCAAMQKPEYLEQIAYELAGDNQAEGVRYIEVRFAPQLHINETMTMEDVLSAVNKGLLRAQTEFNAQKAVKSGAEPPFYYGIIVCALRNFGPWNAYYKSLINSLAYSSQSFVRKLASLELARGAVKIRDEMDIPIVGFDLAGEEDGYPAAEHWRAFQFAHEDFMLKTVHAGEAYGPESIFQAITELHADRIGHGYYLFDTSKIQDQRIKNRDKYVHALSQYIADRRITIEICLTSNMQTNPTIGDLHHHTFRRMLNSRICTVICTDNRTASKTTVSKEMLLALKQFQLTHKSIMDIVIDGFKHSFFPKTYAEKRAYMRQCIDFYQSIRKRYSGLELPLE